MLKETAPCGTGTGRDKTNLPKSKEAVIQAVGLYPKHTGMSQTYGPKPNSNALRTLVPVQFRT